MKHLYYTYEGGFLPVFVYTVCGNEICQIAEIDTYADSDFPDNPDDTVKGWLQNIKEGNESCPIELKHINLGTEVIIHEL